MIDGCTRSSVPKQRGVIKSDSVKAIKIMPSRHEDRIGSQDGL